MSANTHEQPQGQPQGTTQASSFRTVFGGRHQLAGSDSAVSKVMELAKQALETTDANVRDIYRLVAVPSAMTGSFGGVAILYTVAAEQELKTFYHLIMVERARSTPLEKGERNYMGSTISYDVTVGDTYTMQYRNQVAEYLKGCQPKTLGNTRPATFHSAGYQIIYSDTPIDAPERFNPILEEATRSLEHAANRVNSNAPIFSLKYLQKTPNTMLATQVTTDAVVKEPNGMPIRSDIAVTLSLVEKGDPNNPTATSSNTVVCSTSAYVDLVYLPQQQGLGLMQPMFNGSKLFIPRVTISQSLVHTPVSSLEFSLLNLAAVATILSNRSYGVVWRNSFGQEGINLRDIGAIGYIAPALTENGQGGRIDVDDPLVHANVLEVTMHKSAIFSMDIRQGGAGNFINDIYLRASNPSDTVAQADILRAASNLTNREFDSLFDKTQPIVSAEKEVIPDGYFNIGSTIQSTAKIDLLAVLNMFGAKDMSVVSAYLKLTGKSTMDSVVRMHRRNALLSSFTKGYTVKAYATKITFSAAFITALTEAVAKAKVAFTSNQFTGVNDEQIYTQTVDDWANFMVDPSKINNTFQQPQPTYNGNNVFMPGAMNTFW